VRRSWVKIQYQGTYNEWNREIEGETIIVYRVRHRREAYR
jgi:hypothetical protein